MDTRKLMNSKRVHDVTLELYEPIGFVSQRTTVDLVALSCDMEAIFLAVKVQKNCSKASNLSVMTLLGDNLTARSKKSHREAV